MAQASRRQPAQAPSVQRQYQRKATKSVMESSLPRSSTVFSLTKIRAPSGATPNGILAQESTQVPANWPPTDETSLAVRLTINNSMNEVCHGIRFAGGWPEHLQFSRDEACDVFSRWSGKGFLSYPVQTESLVASERGSIRIITATGAMVFDKHPLTNNRI
jgi:hypothetical protein